MEAKRGNVDKIIQQIMERKRAALYPAGALVQSQAKALCPVGQYPSGSGIVGGALRNSIYLKVIGNIAYIGTSMIYGPTIEFGASITPVYAKALTIPIHPEAYGKRASDFPDLFMIKRENAPPLLVRKKGESIEPIFVLLKRVEIPKQPYLRPAAEIERKNVVKLLQAA